MGGRVRRRVWLVGRMGFIDGGRGRLSKRSGLVLLVHHHAPGFLVSLFGGFLYFIRVFRFNLCWLVAFR